MAPRRGGCGRFRCRRRHRPGDRVGSTVRRLKFRARRERQTPKQGGAPVDQASDGTSAGDATPRRIGDRQRPPRPPRPGQGAGRFAPGGCPPQSVRAQPLCCRTGHGLGPGPGRRRTRHGGSGRTRRDTHAHRRFGATEHGRHGQGRRRRVHRRHSHHGRRCRGGPQRGGPVAWGSRRFRHRRQHHRPARRAGVRRYRRDVLSVPRQCQRRTRRGQ
jgi:hypothetical protein